MTQMSIMQNSVMTPSMRRVMLEVLLLNRSRTGVVVLIRKRMTTDEALQAAQRCNAPGRIFIQSGDVHQRAWWEKR